MTKVTIPADGPAQGVAQGWLQVDKRVHQKMGLFGIKHPSALALLHFMTSRLHRGTNGVLMSLDALVGITGLSKRTVQNSIKALAEARFIQVLKSGKSNIYIINSQVAWQGPRGHRFAVFNAEIMVTEGEQDLPVDALMEQSAKLESVPIFEPGERALIGNEFIDPPDQGELDLP
jgi:hypothetical protein